MAKTSEKIARRYARALFELCPAADLEATRDYLAQLSLIWRSNSELRAALLNPATQQNQRLAALAEVCKQIAPENVNFQHGLQVLFLKGRMNALPDVALIFSRMVDEIKKLLALEISSAFPLSPEEKNSVLEKIQKKPAILQQQASIKTKYFI